MKVFIIAAITADGFIARHSDHLADWTSKEDKQLFVRLTKEAGVIVMGSTTFATIGRALPGRRMLVYSFSPETVDYEGVEATNEEPSKLVDKLRSEGANGVAICGGASIYNLFIRSGLVDELYLTVEPKLFGTGIQLFSDELDTNLELMAVRKLNKDTVLLHYKLLHTDE